MAQIETALIGCNTWNKWRDNIKGKMIIKRSNMWTNYLRLGSLLLLCGLFMGCDTTRTEWVHRGEWVYRNESTHEIRITGVITSFTTDEFGTLVLSPGDMRTVEFMSDGERDIPPAGIGFPLDKIYGDGNAASQSMTRQLCRWNQIKVSATEKIMRSRNWDGHITVLPILLLMQSSTSCLKRILSFSA